MHGKNVRIAIIVKVSFEDLKYVCFRQVYKIGKLLTNYIVFRLAKSAKTVSLPGTIRASSRKFFKGDKTYVS